MTTIYKFTAKFNNIRYPIFDDYDDWIHDVTYKRKFVITDYTFELDSIGKLHIHGLAKARPGYYAPNLKKGFKGIHTTIGVLEKKNDIKGWKKYMYKDQSPDGLKKLQVYQCKHYEARTAARGEAANNNIAVVEQPDLVVDFN